MLVQSRSKIISFRLDAQDYKELWSLCFSQGIASVSELVRVGIHSLLQQPSRVPPQTLESRVVELEGRLQDLAREIGSLNPNSSLQVVEKEDLNSHISRSAREEPPTVGGSSI